MDMWQWLARARQDVAQGLTDSQDLAVQFSQWFATLKAYGPETDPAYYYNDIQSYAIEGTGWSEKIAHSAPFVSTSPASGAQAPGANPPDPKLAQGTIKSEFAFVRKLVEDHPVIVGLGAVGVLMLLYKTPRMDIGR